MRLHDTPHTRTYEDEQRDMQRERRRAAAYRRLRDHEFEPHEALPLSETLAAIEAPADELHEMLPMRNGGAL